MSSRCTPHCVVWPQPAQPCVPCIDPDNPADLALWEQAWQEAVDYVYDATCNRWPGTCFVEEVRPCVAKCGHFGDCRCGQFTYLPLEGAFCLPVVDVLAIKIGPTSCNPDGQVWTQATGEFRVEWQGDCPIIVLQNAGGCCGSSWPTQDLCRPNGDPCTWSIVAKTGCAPPKTILTGTGALAAKIAEECQVRNCKVSRNVTQRVVRGTSFSYDLEELSGSATHGMMLDKLLEKYECTEGDFEQFGDFETAVRFHTVHGPRFDEDCVEPTCNPTPEPEPEPEPLPAGV